MPRLSALFSEGRLAEFRSILFKTVGVAVGIGLVSAICVSVLAESIITIINPEQDPSRPAALLSVMIWVLPFMTIKDLVVVSLVASDQQAFMARVLTVLFALSVPLHFVLTEPNAAFGLIAVFYVVETVVIVVGGLKSLRATSIG